MAKTKNCLDARSNPSVCQQGWRGGLCQDCKNFSLNRLYPVQAMISALVLAVIIVCANLF